MTEEIDGGIKKLLGEERGSSAIEKSKVIVPEDFELSTSHLLGILIPVGRGSSSCFALSALQLDVEYYLAEFVPKMSHLSRYETEGETSVFTHSKAIRQRLNTKSAFRMADSTGIDFSLRQTGTEHDGFQTDEDTLVDYLECLNKEVAQIKSIMIRLLKFREAAKLFVPNASAYFARETENRKNDVSAILSRVGEIFKDVDGALLAAEVRKQ